MTAQKGSVRVRNGCCCGSVQSSRTRPLDSVDSVPVEVEEREVGLHPHWMKFGSSSSRLDLAAPEHVTESLSDGQNSDGTSCSDGELTDCKHT